MDPNSSINSSFRKDADKDLSGIPLIRDASDVSLDSIEMAEGEDDEYGLKLFVATWNAGNAAPEGFDRLIPVDGDYDVLAIGLQESTWGPNAAAHEPSVAVLKDRLMEAVGAQYAIVSNLKGALEICGQLLFSSCVLFTSTTPP